MSMPNAKRTLENLKAYFEAEMIKAEKLSFSGTRPLRVLVHTTFKNWLARAPRPGVTLVGSDLSISSQHPMGPRHVVTLKCHPRMAFPEGTYIYEPRIRGSSPFERTLRKVSAQEGADGFLPATNLIEHRPLPAGDYTDYMAILHWITDPDRWPHIDVMERNYSTLVFRFRDPNQEFEFKLAFNL